jgi:HK97 family phage portal protein
VSRKLTKAERRARAIASTPAAETRAHIAGDPIFAPWGGMDSAGLTGVNSRTAEQLSTVLACVNLIGTAIAALPVHVYRQDDDGRAALSQHPLARLVQRGPNDHQTWPDWVEWTLAQVLLRGNALSELIYNGAGRVVGLNPLPWDFVSVSMLPSGRLVYDVSEVNSVYGGTGGMRRLLADEVLHVRDRTDDGLLGRSRLQRAAGAVQGAFSTQRYSQRVFRNGVRPSAVITMKRSLSPAGLLELEDRFWANYGGRHSGGVMILDTDMDLKSMPPLSPEDQELLMSRRFSVEEIARIFQTPPVMIGDLSNSSFTNAETLGRYFAMFTLRPWCKKLESQIARAVFSDADAGRLHLEFDLSDLLRGDPATRWKNHQIAVQAGILTANEIREIEGWNRREGGDDVPGRADPAGLAVVPGAEDATSAGAGAA